MANVAAPQPLIIYDMPQMTKFVYDFYANKVAAMTEISKPPAINKLEDNQVEGKTVRDFYSLIKISLLKIKSGYLLNFKRLLFPTFELQCPGH